MLRNECNTPNITTPPLDLMVVENTLQELAKKVEFLQAENKKCQITINEYESFKRSIGQTLHDLRSPLACLYMITDSAMATELPEQMRISLRLATINATDITDNALYTLKPQAKMENSNNKRQAVMLSTLLQEIVNSKRLEAKNLPIEFEYSLNKQNAFLSIKVAPSDFKRAISNLLNNAIDAMPASGAKIKITLEANNEWVYVRISDNGNGIPEEVLTKIKNRVAITHGKSDGHGIGLTQVRDMLNNNYGKFAIASSTHTDTHGTTLTLSLPRIANTSWSVDKINISPNDTVIILDDDSSIHDTWEAKFNDILDICPDIKIKYFLAGNEVINYVTNLSADDKRYNICFLCDYQLGKNEDLTGLELIQHCQIKRSILVTNYHSEPDIRRSAIQNNIKLLPKELIGVVTLNIS